MNFKKITLFITLLIILVGIISATEVSEDSIDTDTIEKECTDTPSNTDIITDSVIEKQNDNKEIIKDEKSIKTASKSYTVNDYSTLRNALTSNSYDTVTVNIKSDIKLSGSITLNNAVKKLTVNANGKTISGNAQYKFLRINSANVTINNIIIKNCFGENGSALYNNRGNVTIKNSSLIYNSASDSGAAIYNSYARLTMTNCTLRGNEAVNYDNYGGAIYNTHSTVILKDSKFIDNYASDGGAIFNDHNSVLNITNCTINDNYGDVGGAIFNEYSSHVNIKNSKLNNNYASLYGGAIYNVDAYLDIINSTLNSNYGRYYGGAILNYGNLKITKSVLNNNNATESGGAIYTDEGSATIINSTLNINNIIEEQDQYYASGGDIYYLYKGGGAIYNGGKLSITNSTLNNNKNLADRDEYYTDCGGGAICNHNGSISITHSTLNSNYAKILGGAIYCNKGNITITNSNLNNNTAVISGAIENEGGNLNIRNTTFNKNIATMDSGAITHFTGNLTINNCTFNNNVAAHDIGAVYTGGYAKITNTIFKSNSAKGYGGAVTNGEELIVTSCIFDGNKLTGDYSCGGAIDNNGYLTVQSSTFKYNSAENGGAIYNHNKATIEKNTFTANKANMRGKAIINDKTATIYNNTNADTSKYSGTIYTNGTNVLIRNNIFDDAGKLNTKTTVSTVSGIIGEKLTLKATVLDENNNKINTGNLIFKLNGVTIKDNGKLTGSSNPLKVKVTNGQATATIIPDLDMRNANKLTASYIGTTTYNPSASNTAKIQISQRNASIVVSSNVKTIKQGQVLTITARVYDTTNGKKSTNLTKYADEFVYFKVNGITLKDSNGNMLKVKVVNGTATTKYTIPLGLSGVTDGKTMTPKNHTILAGFYNKNYQENIRNTSYFQVERSNITILIADATVNKKTHKLSLTAIIKDYLGNVVAGPNKCVIKINGISLKNGTEAMYYYSTNGILNLNNIDIPKYTNYTSVEIVTQDRLAYKSQRNTTSTIKII